MKMTRTIASVGAAAAVLLAAQAASAFTINLTDSVTGENTGSTASAAFSFAAQGANVRVSVLLTNTSVAPVVSDFRGFLFDIPAPPGAYVAGSFGNLAPAGGAALTWFAYFNQNLSGSGFGSFDLCVTTESGGSGSNVCNGIPTDGLDNGEYDAFYIDVSGWGTDAAAAELAFRTLFSQAGHVCGRFQSVSNATGGGLSDKVCGTYRRPPDEKLPEPGTLALLGLGLIGIGAARRRNT